MTKTSFCLALLRTVSLVLAATILPAAIGPVVAYAQAEQRTHEFDLPSQPLADALRAVGSRAGVNVVFEPSAVRGRQAPPLRGSYTVEEAVRRLIEGSDLNVRKTEGGSLLISVPPTSGGGGERSSEASIQKGEKITVVGTNIRGVAPAGSALENYTAEDIGRMGVTTTEQFIQKLPQNLGTRSLQGGGIVRAGGTGNQETIAAIDLRGLGLGTTLVLVNGRRIGLSDFGRTVDVSLIPLEAVERVEILNDGASAIYGSDAVGGVVNFVLRKDFDGAETRLSYGGVTSGGMRQGDLAQTFGWNWASGRALLSYNYFSADPLAISDRSYAAAADRGNLTPMIRRHGLLATFSQDLTNRLELSGDLIVARRKATDVTSGALGARTDWFEGTARNKTDQYLANAALDYRISDSLTASIKGTSSEADFSSNTSNLYYNQAPPAITTSTREKKHSIYDLTATLDGKLFRMPGGDARFSVGAGYMEEEYSGAALLSGLPTTRTLGRGVTYGFGEVFLPVMQRLELSLAARYTKYKDKSEPALLNREFGDGTDPKIGANWSPIDAISLRGTYGTSFRAPSLSQLDDLGGTFAFFNNRAIPSPSGPRNNLMIVLNLPAPNLQPETAETYTLGFDFRPPAVRNLKLSGTYYNISYKDRIGVAPADGAAYQATPDLYPLVIYRPPSAAFIEQILRTARTAGLPPPTGVNINDPAAAAQALFAAGNTYIVDQRRRNLAVSEQNGFDLSLAHQLDSRWGAIRYGGNVTYIRSYEQQASATSLVVSVIDKVTQPANLRGRAYVGLSQGGFDGTLNVNYVDSYANPFAPVGGPQRVASWTTFDLSVNYDFGKASGWLHGTRVGVSVQNLFDRSPPFVLGGGQFGVEIPLGFDPVNANPLGRFVMFGVTKRW